MVKNWQRMSLAELRDFESILDPPPIHRQGVYWRRVRPFFYRPLVPFEELAPERIVAPRLAALGGFQHAVGPGVTSNSFLNFRIFTSAQEYSIASLDKKRRRQVKIAVDSFEIAELKNVGEFKQAAYPVYLSFFARTGYEHGSERQDKARFDSWAEKVFDLKKVLVLGAFRDGALAGISLSFLLGNTLFYSSFFCDTPSLKFFLSDLMLHYVREAASQCPEIHQVYTGMYKGENSLDAFYELRGCRIVRKPAILRVNPLMGAALKCFSPQRYRLLIGAEIAGEKATVISRPNAEANSVNSAQQTTAQPIAES